MGTLRGAKRAGDAGPDSRLSKRRMGHAEECGGWEASHSPQEEFNDAVTILLGG
jgi:hypothetical protein